MTQAVLIRPRAGVLALAGTLLVITGCGGPASAPSSRARPAEPPAPPDAASTSPPAAARPENAVPAEVTLQVVKFPQLHEALAAHRGKVVVLDVWATY
jgi:hypothetical protein